MTNLSLFGTLMALAFAGYMILDHARTIILIRNNRWLGRFWLRLPIAVVMFIMLLLIAFALVCRLAQMTMLPG